MAETNPVFGLVDGAQRVCVMAVSVIWLSLSACKNNLGLFKVHWSYLERDHKSR